MRCKNCKYDLTGVVAYECPECGRPFDPSDRASYYSFVDVQERRRRWLIAGIAAAMLVVFALACSGLFVAIDTLF